MDDKKFKIDAFEEQLQSKFENSSEATSKDEIAYKLVFRALRKEVEFPLSESFADKVMMVVKEKAEPKSKSIFEYVIFGVGLFLLLVAFVASIVLTEFTFEWGFLKSLSSYKWLFLMGFVMIALFNIIDVRLVRNNKPTIV